MAVATRSEKRSSSFQDKLGRLTRHQALQLLGEEAEKLLGEARRRFEPDPEADVYLGGDLYRVRVEDHQVDEQRAIVILTQKSDRSQQLHLTCDRCERPCAHAAAALQLLLEEKTAFGLAAPPDESVPFELLTREELVARMLDERQKRAATEKMTIKSADASTPWTDYVLTSRQSGKTYRVALRGLEPGQAYCSCPDFRTNRLGTCKHILNAKEKVQRRFTKPQLAKRYAPREISAWLDYGDTPGVRITLPENVSDKVRKLVGTAVNRPITNGREALALVQALEAAGAPALVYPDTEAWLERELLVSRMADVAAAIRKKPATHPLRKSLLKAPLLPYQMDGIAFAAGAGRAILADDMGLGKTIQGIGTAELLAREIGIERVLVVCPASLKSQWRDEIHRFCDRSVQLILGRGDERTAQYNSGAFFTVCNYEQLLCDLSHVEQVPWDLIILDEGQRIKNWESKTSQVVRSLQSKFALVLTGTPLENRLDDLYTVIKFVDDQRLGPAYEFFHRHRIVDERGRVDGYQRLDEIREKLKPILLRRTRASVLGELPERTTTVVRITPTAEQMELHTPAMQAVQRITSKKFLTEIDLLNLRRALLAARMAANGTYLVDKQPPGFSSKLDRLSEMLGELVEHDDRKVILFSEWTTMLDLIEPLATRAGMDFVRLDGQVNQSKRPAVVRKFMEDADCRLILMTNAGATGLNLQAANTVINVDLPWNPAILEQRIARAHRMGVKHPVDVYLLVTENTLEERLLDTLATKQDLALAALDVESDVREVQIKSGMEDLKRRLEQLIGPQPTTPVDESRKARVAEEVRGLTERRERVAAAGGQLIGAAFQMLGELVSDRSASPDPAVVQQLQSGLADCVERDGDGRPQLRITLPDEQALSGLAQTLAKLLLAGRAPAA